MRISFRQGIARQQTDITNNPNFLLYSGSGVSINVSPDETVVAFAHGFDADYIFEEQQSVPNAWTGPFTPGTDYWLYWDLDPLTGLRTFGHTIVEPIDGPSEPPAPLQDQHWFDTTVSVHKIRKGARWHEVIRCFAAKLDDGGVLIQYPTGTQVGFNTTVDAGTLLFDDEGNAVKKFDRFGRGKFITTESPLSSQAASLANFRLEGLFIPVKAIEFIPKNSCIAYKGPNEIGLASFNDPSNQAIGISIEEMFIGEVRTFVQSGYIINEAWNWTQSPGTRLFVGGTGEVSPNVPQQNSIQHVGTIISPNKILVDIRPIVRVL